MNLALDLAFWEAEQEGFEEGHKEGRKEGQEELAQATLLVRNGCSTVEALEAKGVSKSVAKKALKLAKELGVLESTTHPLKGVGLQK